MNESRPSWRVQRDRVLDVRQVARIRAAIGQWIKRGTPDAEYAMLFMFLVNVPLRLSEALAIARADLHLDRAAPFARVRRLKKRKGRVQIDDIALPREAVAAVTGFGGARPFPFSKFQAIRAFHRLCTDADVDLPKHCAVHILRHTIATHVLRRTKNLRVVQDLLGHDNPATTAGYAHVALDDQATALNDLWGKGV